MTFRSCSREAELTQALRAGHWPAGCDRELRAHVEACSNCSDLVLVTETFQRARSQSAQAALSMSPDLIWWRAQLRRSNAAAERVSKPVTIAQIFAWFVITMVAGVFVATQYRHGLRWALWWSELAPSRAFHVWSLAAERLDWNLALLVPSLGGLVVLSGVVLYLLSERR